MHVVNPHSHVQPSTVLITKMKLTGHRGQLVVVGVQHAQGCEVAHVFGQAGQLVAGQAQPLQGCHAAHHCKQTVLSGW